MIYNQRIQKAIHFAIKTHEVFQKQKRKGKDIPYIVHPLTVAFVLSMAKATEDVIIAGILHDTIEDSIPKKKVTYEMIEQDFGKEVAILVETVTEKNDIENWLERKEEAMNRIEDFSTESILLKSADVLVNVSEIIDDYRKVGEDVFDRFRGKKEKTKEHYLKIIKLLIEKWPNNPLLEDLVLIEKNLKAI